MKKENDDVVKDDEEFIYPVADTEEVYDEKEGEVK